MYIQTGAYEISIVKTLILLIKMNVLTLFMSTGLAQKSTELVHLIETV